MLADRATGKMVSQIYEAPSLFTFHHGNAYEKDGYLIMDLSYYNDATVFSKYLIIRELIIFKKSPIDCYRFNPEEHERKRLLYKPVLRSLRPPIKFKGSFLRFIYFVYIATNLSLL